MDRILILANNDIGLYKFRIELIQELVNYYEVFISLPYGEFVSKLQEYGCEFINTPIDRRGANPVTDLKLLLKYISILKKVRPAIVLTYTIKPNIYGGLSCRILHIPYISNITGLGTSIENVGFVQKIALMLYKFGLKKSICVFFQNTPNRNFFLDKKIVTGKSRIIPGSGVNLEQHRLEEYPQDDNGLNFLFIGRIMKDKGICEFLDAAVRVKAKYLNVQFDLIGELEEDYKDRILELARLDIIKYHGRQNDVHSFIKNSHATILPSYHEGIANALLESASVGRPVLASKVTGCQETFNEGNSGMGFEVQNVDSLVNTIIQFIELPFEKKRAMGLAGRKKMELEYDRNIVIKAYMEEIIRAFRKVDFD